MSLRKWAGVGLCMLILTQTACSSPWSLTNAVQETGQSRTSGDLTLVPVRVSTQFDGAVEAERGRLRVPLSRSADDTTTISVHWIRYPATTADPGDPIVYLAGGPGGSGTASSVGDRAPLFQRLRRVADVIAFDQRGTWNSDPYMVCPGSWSLEAHLPLSEAMLSAAVASFVRECHAHWTAEGIDLDSFNTRENAADLDDLRRALGADRLDLLAISYGTHLALEFARTFPGSVGRMVLAGTEGVDGSLKSPAAIQNSLERIDGFFQARESEAVTRRLERILEAVGDTGILAMRLLARRTSPLGLPRAGTLGRPHPLHLRSTRRADTGGECGGDRSPFSEQLASDRRGRRSRRRSPHRHIRHRGPHRRLLFGRPTD